MGQEWDARTGGFAGAWNIYPCLPIVSTMFQESIDPLHQSHLPSAPVQSLRQRFGIREKKMVELAPLMVDMKKEHKQMRFSRFMAVP